MTWTKQLSEAEFNTTFDPPMERLPLGAEPPFDFWTYFDSIPPGDFKGHNCSGNVDYVYRNCPNNYIHVLVNTDHQNVFMVIVLKILSNTVFGHYLLSLDEKYEGAPDEKPEV